MNPCCFMFRIFTHEAKTELKLLKEGGEGEGKEEGGRREGDEEKEREEKEKEKIKPLVYWCLTTKFKGVKFRNTEVNI